MAFFQFFFVPLQPINHNFSKMKQTMKVFFATALTSLFCSSTLAQTVTSELQEEANRAAGIYYALPVPVRQADTPPDGKKPFYINHYGSPASYYQEEAAAYEAPYATLAKADSLGKLTTLGRNVLQKVNQIRLDAKERYGELTTKGTRQARAMTLRRVESIPDMFVTGGYYSAMSAMHNHCIQTMDESMLQLAGMRRPLRMGIRSSQGQVRFMDPEDKLLVSQRTDSLTLARYADFKARHTDDTRLMASLFNDSTYIKSNINTSALSRQLFVLAGCVQHTNLTSTISLYDIFTPDEIHNHWLKQNAWHYISYGGYTINGGYQAYLQRSLLRNMMHMGDSAIKRVYPMVHMRYTHENVVMSLACLMELDGYGLHTDSLDALEEKGWADYRIAPLGGSIEMIHYRSDFDDKDVLVKVLLNGREARLPIPTDCPPYYHWQDVKHYYLRKLYRYENVRFTQKTK